MQVVTLSHDAERHIRAVGIVLHGTQVLLMRRLRAGRRYWVFPGGGVESGETVEQAVSRELLEETSLAVTIGRLLYHVHHPGLSHEYYYHCTCEGGAPVIGGEELEETQQGDVHEPLWMPVAALPNLTLYPLEIRDLLIAGLANGFASEPLHLRIPSNEIRQE